MKLLTRAKTGALLCAVALVGGATVPTAALAAPPSTVLEDPIRLDQGHIDAFKLILNEDDTPRLVLQEDVTGSHVLRTPESVEMFVKPSAKITVPEGFVPGMPTDVYHLPLTQDPQLIWPGWDTNSLAPAFDEANVNLVVTGVTGPGDVFLWTTTPFGQVKSLLAGDGFKFPGTIPQPYPAHTHAAWAFTAAGTYKMTVRADVASGDGSKTAASNTATYTFVVSEPSAPTLSISGLKHHYHQGSKIVLNAEASSAVADASYEWFLQRKDQTEPVKVVGQNGPQLTLTAEQAFNQTKVFARLLDANGTKITEADLVTISVDDHGAGPVQKVTISGVADHYHSNANATLKATVSPESVLTKYAWEVKPKGEDKWYSLGDISTSEATFMVKSYMNGGEIRARLVFDDGSDYVASAPVSIAVEDHGSESPAETTLTIEGLADTYKAGDTMKLKATQDPATGEDHFHWFIKREGAEAFTVFAGELTDSLEYVVQEADLGGQVIARLYDHGHKMIAESAPVVLKAAANAPQDDPGNGGGGSGSNEGKPGQDGSGSSAGSGGNAGSGSSAGSGGNAGSGGGGSNGSNGSNSNSNSSGSGGVNNSTPPKQTNPPKTSANQNANQSPKLARTGAEQIVQVAVLGTLLLAAGAASVVLARRRVN